MPLTSTTSFESRTQDAPFLEGRVARSRRLHVLVTPGADTRALFGSLAALSAVREPRLEVTAIAPPGGAPPIPLDRRFHFIENRRDQLPQVLAELETNSVLFLLRAGALPPRGWLETLLAHGKETGARAVGALAWQPNPIRPPEDELLRWEREERICRQGHYRVVEDRAEVETPLLAIFRPDELRAELETYWKKGCTTNLCLLPQDAKTRVPRLIVAKDLAAWSDASLLALRASVTCRMPSNRAPKSIAESDAIRCQLKAALADGPHPEIHLRLAELELSRGDRNAATRHARACLDDWPDCAEAKLLIARALTGEDRLEAARAIVEKLFHAGPLRPKDRAGLFACLASIWLRGGDPAQAQPCLDVALSIVPNHPVARYGQARIALAGGRFNEALEHLDVCVSEVPLSPDIHFELGRAQVLAGLTDAGRRSLERALELSSDHKKAEALLERLDP